MILNVVLVFDYHLTVSFTYTILYCPLSAIIIDCLFHLYICYLAGGRIII